MTVLETTHVSIDNYVALFDRFSPREREIVLEELQRKKNAASAETDTRTGDEISLDEICGAWQNDGRTAEEVIKEIYDSRTFGRNWDQLYESFSS